MRIELHSKDCACRGTGWISSPGLGPRTSVCHSTNVVRMDEKEWEAFGKPRVIEQLSIFDELTLRCRMGSTAR